MKKKQIVSLAMASIMSISVIGGSIGAAQACESIPEGYLCKEGFYEGLTSDEVEELKALGFTEESLNETKANNITADDKKDALDEEFDAYYYEDFTQNEREILKELNFSNEAIEEMNNLEASGIYIYNGELIGNTSKLYEIMNEGSIVQPRGKVTIALKTIIKVYNKLPKIVRKQIEKYISPGGIIRIIEQTTGALEKSLYKAFRKRGMPAKYAKILSKAIITIAI